VREKIVNVFVDSTGLWEKRSLELEEICDEEMLLKNNLESCPSRSRIADLASGNRVQREE
jgi:hypothetical protein